MNPSRILTAFVMLMLSMTAPVLAQSPLGQIEIGKPFPADIFPLLCDGSAASLSEFKGKRVLLLIFASW